MAKSLFFLIPSSKNTFWRSKQHFIVFLRPNYEIMFSAWNRVPCQKLSWMVGSKTVKNHFRVRRIRTRERKYSYQNIARSPLFLVLQTPGKSFRHCSLPRGMWGVLSQVNSMSGILKSSYVGKLFLHILHRRTSEDCDKIPVQDCSTLF